MNSVILNLKDETGERLLEVGKSFKKQIVGDNNKGDKDDKKDPVTGKPVIGKKLLTQLNQQVAQLAKLRIKKVREELEKQRLKVEKPASVPATAEDSGGAKPKEDVIGRVLKASKSTGEFGKNIGG